MIFFTSRVQINRRRRRREEEEEAFVPSPLNWNAAEAISPR